MNNKQTKKTSSFNSKSLQLISNNKARFHYFGNKVLACMIFVTMIAYVVIINDLSIKGFILQDLKKNISQLEIENEQFELSAMSLESYEFINERAQKLGMVKVDDIEYISMLGTAVAVK